MTDIEETTVTTAEKTMTMAELRECTRSLFVKNLTGGLWTLHDKTGTGRVDFELKPCGQPGSITYLAPHALDAPGISRNLSKGKISVSPDLEQEMVDLESGGGTASQRVLDQYQIKVENSPQARALNVNDKVRDVINESQGRSKGIVPQGLQGKSTVDEFNTPSPFKTEDGRWFDPASATFIESPKGSPTTVEADTGINSVTITRPARLQEEK